MACDILTGKYISFVQKLIKFDPTAYRSYDNAVRFVLDSDLTPEQKKLSIHQLAYIYDGLAGVDSKFYEPGKAADVKGAVHLLGDTKAYMKFMNSLYKTKAAPTITAKIIEDRLDSMSTQTEFERGRDLFGDKGIITLLRQFFTANGVTGEDRRSYVDMVRKSVTEIIDSFTEDPAYNATMRKYMSEALDELLQTTNYVDINDLPIEAQLNNVLISLNNRELVEGFIEDGVLYMIDDKGEMIALSKEDIRNYKAGRPLPFDSNSAEERVSPTMLYSAMKIQAAFGEDADKLRAEMATMENPMSRIRIHAVRPGIAQARMERIQELASTNPEMAGLANRKHETFESTGQISYLKNTPGGVVLSVARPNQEENKFQLVGELLMEDGQNILFNLWTLDNYVFVYDNNTTEKVDFNNPAHRERFQKLALLNGVAGPVELTESDMAALMQSYNQLQQFKAKHGAAMEDMFTKGINSVDFTEEFFESFDMSQGRTRENPSLEEFMETDSSLSLELEVATIDDDENVLSTTKRKVPFVFYRVGSRDTAFFMPNSVLAANERIKVGDSLYSEEDYFEYELGITNIDQFIKENLFSDNKYSQKNTMIVVRFKDGQPTSYLTLEDQKPMQTNEGFVDFINMVADMVSTKERTAKGQMTQAAQAFNSMYRFSGARGPFYLNLEFFKGTLKFELVPKDKSNTSPLKVMLEQRSKFQFAFSDAFKARLIGLAEELGPKGKKIQQVLADNPSLKAYDLSTVEGRMGFYTALSVMEETNSLTESAQDLVDYLNETREKFSQFMIDLIVKPLQERMGEHPEVEAALRSTYTFPNEGFNLEYLVVDKDNDGNKWPHVGINRKKGASTPTFYRNSKRFTVKHSNRAETLITAKAGTAMSPATKEVVDRTSPSGQGTSITAPPVNIVEPVTTITADAAVVNADVIIEAFEALADGIPVNELNAQQQEIVNNPTYAMIYNGFMDNMNVVAEQMEAMPDEETEAILNSMLDQMREELTNAIDAMNAPEPSVTIGAYRIAKINGTYDIEHNEDGIVAEYIPTLDEAKRIVEEYQREEAKANPSGPSSAIPKMEDEAFKIADEYEAATMQDIKSEVAWFREALGQFGIEISDMEGVVDLMRIDGTVLGLFKDKVLHLNKSMLSKGIVYHEAFHGVFRYLMTDTQRRELLNNIIDNPKYADQFTDANLIEFARVRNFVYNKAEMMDLVAEEILADGFQRYMRSRRATAPKGIMAKLFELLKKLITMFKANRDVIETTYRDIATGKYKESIISGTAYDGKAAFEIKGLRKVVMTPTGRVMSQATTLLDEYEKEAVNMVVRQMLADNSKRKFEEKFQDAATVLLNEVYNIDMLLRQADPKFHEDIKKEFLPKYNQMRFILGQRMRDLKAGVETQVYDINTTGKEENDALFLDNGSNTDGSESMATLMGLVRKRLNEFSVSSTNPISVENMEGAMNAVAKPLDENAENREENPESADFEKAINEINRMDSLPGEFKKFLSTIRRDYVHPVYGILVPAIVDGRKLTPTLLKIAANKEPMQILPTLKMVYERWYDDGLINEAMDLEAVYNEIKKLTLLDNGSIPMTNAQMYRMVLNVLHGTRIGYVMFNMQYFEAPDMDNIEEMVDKDTTPKFSISDKIQYKDINNKKNRLVERMILTQKSERGSDAYRKALLNAIQIATKISTAETLFTGDKSQRSLDNMVDELHKSLWTIGLQIPKSMLRFSMIAIQEMENEKTISKLDEKTLEQYELDRQFANEKEYLEKTFFTNLKNILEAAAGTEGATPKMFENMLDDESTASPEVKSFNSILRKAAKFMVKYDPTAFSSVVYNAEGKPIYEYIKYSPMIITAEDVRQKGLEASLAEDQFYESYLKDFITNNHLLGGVMEGKTDEMTKMVKLLLNNMRVEMFGGVQGKVGDTILDGRTFGDLDEHTLHILNFTSFLSRMEETSNEKDGKVTIQTYRRSFHQLESSNTNFLVTSLYRQFADKNGVKKVKIEGVPGTYKAIVQDLIGVIRQEYESMRKEFGRREEFKKLFESQTSDEFIKEFNGRLDANDKVQFTDKDGKPLRAYKFHKLADFFAANPAIEEALVEAAQDGIEFDELDLGGVPSYLDEYAQQEFNTFLKVLENNNIIQSAQDNTAEGAAPVNYFFSTLLPSKLKVGYQKPVNLMEIYGNVKGTAVSRLNWEAVLADYFYNNWTNALHFNDIFDGNQAMNVKSAQDAVKRNKKYIAAGDSMQEGTHRAAVVDTIKGFIHEDHPEYGPYFSEEEIAEDPMTTPELKVILAEDFKRAIAEENGAEDFGGKYAGMLQKIFDGQSVSLLMHQMDMHETLGRMTSKVHDLLIAKHYRKLTESEIMTLQAMKVVNNSKKTITASRHSYHKQSENMFDRLDVSRIKDEYFDGTEETEQDVYDMLHTMWSKVYELRKQYQRQLKTGEDSKATFSQIQDTVRMIHEFYEPLPHRVRAHEILNAMEYFQIDQFMDAEASKNATRLPINVLRAPKKAGYLNFDFIAVDVDNRYKFLQVETSGVKDKAKLSVQAKMLLPADIQKLADLIEIADNRKLNKSEREFLDNLADRLLADYQDSLRDATRARLLYLTNIMRGMVPSDALARQKELSKIANQDKVSSEAAAQISKLGDIINDFKGTKAVTERHKQNARLVLDALANDKSVSKETYEAAEDIVNDIVEAGNFKVSKIYNMIRENLAVQGAPQQMLEMFELDAAGKPVYSPNLPEIRSMLEYYFFSQYSKHVTDEKGSGGKFIHISQFGYDVLYNKDTGEVIKTQEYAKNKAAYPNVGVRKLGVTSEPELDKDGKPTGRTIYMVECILPEPFRDNPEFREFFEQELTRLFATRIPTEDKRSMVILKAVDYMDSSNLNGIIVPYFVHMLAGSDFDVDTLYAQAYSYYKNMNGQFVKYGDYKNYRNEREGKFVEFMHFITKKDEFKDLIASRLREIREEGTFDLDSDSDVFKYMKMLGFTTDDFVKTINLSQINARIEEMQADIEALSEQRDELGDYLDELKDQIALGETKKGGKKRVNSLKDIKQKRSKAIDEIRGVKQQLADTIKDIRPLQEESWEAASTAEKFMYAAAKVKAMFDVLSKFDIPINIEEFEKHEFMQDLVADKYQNQNLNARQAILGNEQIFNYLYKKERSSVDRFKQLAKEFGIDLKKAGLKTNQYTITSMIRSKADNGIFKDGIGITANMNKFLAMASWYELELEKPVWQFHSDKTGKNWNRLHKFGAINAEKQRVIALIGNVLGMFADGAKEPIPSALKMNDVNTGVTLAMIGVGLRPEFALGFNFIPEIAQASATVIAAQRALRSTTDKQFASLSSEVRKAAAELLTPEVFQELTEAGLFDEDMPFFDPRINKSKLVIEFSTPLERGMKLDDTRMSNNELTIGEIGYTVKGLKSDAVLSEDAQKWVLLNMYEQQAAQSFDIATAGSMINMLKALNPEFTSFDKIYSNMASMMSGESIFTEESMKPLLEDQVWNELFKMGTDLAQQSSNLFLERGPFFKQINNVFKELFMDKSHIAKTIVGYVGIKRLRDTLPGSRKSADSYIQSLIDREDQALRDTFTAEFWFTNTLGEELRSFQAKYPNNKFLNYLKEEVVESQIAQIGEEQLPMRFIKMINTVKLKSDEASGVYNDVMSLMNDQEGKLFLKKLFYHELARGGMGNKKNMFYNFLPRVFRKELSNNIDLFVNTLKTTYNDPDAFEKMIQDFFGATDNDKVYDAFDMLFTNMVYNAIKEPNNTRIKTRFNLNISEKKRLMQTLPVPEGMSADDKRAAITNVINAMFGKSGEIIPTPSRGNLVLPMGQKELGAEFVINMTDEALGIYGLNDFAIARLAGMFGIETGNEGQFAFPMVIKFQDGSVYMLQGAGDEVSGTIGENVFNTLSGKSTSFATSGKAARYTLMPSNLMAEAISPMGFDADEINKFAEIMVEKVETVVESEDNYVPTDFRATQTLRSTPEPEIEEEDGPEEVDETEGSGMTEDTSMAARILARKKGIKVSEPVVTPTAEKTETKDITPKEPKEKIALEPGRYVKFNDAVYIVTKINANKTIQIYNPTKEGAGSKVSVAERNLTPMAESAQIVSYKDQQYMVTPKGNIISMATFKQMKWAENDGNRLAIMELAKTPAKNITENSNIKASIPQNKVSGVESFGSLVKANAQVEAALGPDARSIDMILGGFRTRTTRSEKEMAKYNIQVGDVIKHFGTSADGTTKQVLARVTAVHPKGTPGWKGTWEKEGWRKEDAFVIDRFKTGAAAIEFELLDNNKPAQVQQQPAGPEIFEDEDGNLEASLEKDLVDLNLSDKALRYLYANSSQRMTFEKFAQEAKRFADKMRGVKSTEDIIDDITCL